MTERDQDIDYWWSGGFPGAEVMDDDQGSRLLLAFATVLRAMPDEHFARFMAESPTVVCQPGVNGAAFRYRIDQAVDEDSAHLTVIYLAGTIFRHRDPALADIVAHEAAHVVLGHCDTAGSASRDEREAQADELSVSWGFHRRYSKRALDGLRGVGELGGTR